MTPTIKTFKGDIVIPRYLAYGDQRMVLTGFELTLMRWIFSLALDHPDEVVALFQQHRQGDPQGGPRRGHIFEAVLNMKRFLLHGEKPRDSDAVGVWRTNAVQELDSFRPALEPEQIDIGDPK